MPKTETNAGRPAMGGTGAPRYSAKTTPSQPTENIVITSNQRFAGHLKNRTTWIATVDMDASTTKRERINSAGITYPKRNDAIKNDKLS